MTLPDQRSASRSDIQALRGWSVLLVLLYHVGTSMAAGGYLGVDVFFVVSGYLITGLLCRDIDAGRFRLRDFYARRAKRLLPAVYTLLAVVVAFSPWLLGGRQFAELGAQVLGTLGFSANVVLLNQQGYFEVDSKLKPLLHMWSLAVEEQYYLAFPLLLLVIPRRFRMALLVAIVATSLAWYLAAPLANDRFFLLWGREWALGIGGLASQWTPAERWKSAARWLTIPAIAVLIVAPTRGFVALTPLVAQIACVIATTVLLGANVSSITNHRVFAPIRWLGDVSYSLYLVHWPLFAFISNAYFTTYNQPWPPALKAAALVVAVLGGAAMYYAVERPWHRAASPTPPKVLRAVLLGATAILLITAASRYVGRDSIAIGKRLQPVATFLTMCPQADGAVCEVGNDPTVLLWGDSHALHLAPAFAVVSPRVAFVQAAKSSCSPLLDATAFSELEQLDLAFSDACLAFNRGVLARLAASPSITTVVLASPLWREVSVSQQLRVAFAGEPARVVHGSLTFALERVRATVAAIRALGKRVVLVGSPLQNDRDIGRCLSRRAVGLPVFGIAADCSIARADADRVMRARFVLLDSLQRTQAVPVVPLADYFCRGDRCVTRVGSTLLYTDQTHLSYEGARYLGSETDFVQRLIQSAR